MRVGMPMMTAALLLFASAATVRASDAAEGGKPVKLTEDEIKKIKAALGDEAETIKKKLDGKEEKHERGMFEKALDLGIWTTVVFLLLLFILTKYAWKPMLAGLDQRERSIAAAAEEAKKAKQEASELREQIAAEKQKAADEIRTMMDQARKSAEQLAAQQRAKDEEHLAAERERLRREITVARDQALIEIREYTVDLATLISTKAIRRNIGADDHRVLVDEALAQMSPILEERKRALAMG